MLHERMDGAAQDILNTAEKVAIDAGVQALRVVLVGKHPYELIIQAAEIQGCDLIFMASHGRSGVEALLLGVVKPTKC